MSEAAMPKGGRTENAFERILRAHPIWLRETRQSARLLRTPWILFALTVLVTLGLSAFGAIAVTDHVSPSNIGSTVFQAFFSIAYIVVVIAGSAIAANAVAAEREGKTFEALQLTGLTPKQITRQKFASSYTQLAQYIVALAPVGALSFVFGGVTTTEVVVAYAFLFLVGGLAVGFGLALSSLMPNMRTALLSTIAVSVVAGPLLWFAFGFGGSAVAHQLWSDVPEAAPIWMPLAYSRAPFGAKYVILLIAAPAAVFGVPGWLLYEVTKANLSADADDRTTGYKRWFFFSAPAVAAVVVAIASLGIRARERIEAGTVGVIVFSLFFAFSAFLFAGDPLKPSRKVVEEWARGNASSMRRFFGPGLARTTGFAMGWGLLVLVVTAFSVITVGMAAGSGSVETYAERLLAFTGYACAFYMFLVAFPAALRARGMRTVVARALSAGVVVLVSTVPWVAAAIAATAGGGGRSDAVAIACPSPFYAAVMMSEIHSYSYSSSSGTIVGMGVFATLVWGMIGLGLFGYVVAKKPLE
jgi:ABC-type transport system involved in multi-copper enzyme maturation permease subunit